MSSVFFCMFSSSASMFDVFSCFFHIPPRTTWQVQWRWTRHSHRSSDSLAFAMHLLCICYMSSHIDFEYAKSATVLIDFQEWLFEQGHVWPGGSWLRRHVHIRFDGTSLRLFSNSCDERVVLSRRIELAECTKLHQFYSGSILEARSHWRRGTKVEQTSDSEYACFKLEQTVWKLFGKLVDICR